MLTVITQLGVYGLDKKKLRKYVSGEIGTYVTMIYTAYLEFKALIDGEPIFLPIIKLDVGKLGRGTRLRDVVISDSRRIAVRCSDGDITRVSMKSICRQFDLFRDFFSDYPNADEITCPSITVHDMDIIIGFRAVNLTESLLYTLELLRPTSSAHFLNFNLNNLSKETVMKLVDGISTEDKEGIISAHKLRIDTLQPEFPILGILPPGSVMVLGAIEMGRVYLAQDEGISLVEHNGWAFVNAVARGNEAAASRIMREGFDDDVFLGLTLRDMGIVSNAVINYVISCRDQSDKENVVRACTMLGIIDGEIVSPFHLDLTQVLIDCRVAQLNNTLAHYGYDLVSHKRALENV
jgi:hypothetical protein